MWANRTRRGKKKNEKDLETEENIIEVRDPNQGLMVYRPSSSVMPARPLGAPPEVPVVAPVVKREIEEEEIESIHLNSLGAETESSILKTSQMVCQTSQTPTPSENTSDKSVLKIKKEPCDDVSGDVPPTLNNAESSQILLPDAQCMQTVRNEKVSTELNQKSIKRNNEVDNFETNECGENSLAMWDLASMFPDACSKNTDQSTADTSRSMSLDASSSPANTSVFQSGSQLTFLTLKRKFLKFCRNEFTRTDVDDSLAYLKSSFPGLKKNPLFTLEVPPKENTAQIPPIAAHSSTEETVSSVECSISTEMLKTILEKTNLPSIPSPSLQTDDQIQFNAPGQQIANSDCSSLKETITVKKEPTSPRKSVPKSTLESDEKIVSTKSNSVLSKIQSSSEPIDSRTVEPPKVRENSDDVEVKGTTVVVKREPTSPKKRKNSCETDLNPAKKHIQKEADPVETLAGINDMKNDSASSNSNAVYKPVTLKRVKAEPSDELSYNPVTDPVRKVYSGGSWSETTEQENRIDVLPIPSIKDVHDAIHHRTTSVSHPDYKGLSDDQNATKRYVSKGTVVSVGIVENAPMFSYLNAVDKSTKTPKLKEVRHFEKTNIVNPKHISPEKKSRSVDWETYDNENINLSPSDTTMERQIYSDCESSLSKPITTVKNNRMDDSRVSSLPINKDMLSIIDQSVNSTSGSRIPVIDRFLSSNDSRISAMAQIVKNPHRETFDYEVPQKKRKLTPEEYRRRKGNRTSLESNSPKSELQSISVSNLSPVQMYPSDKIGSESFPRDPRMQKSVHNPPSFTYLPISHNPNLNILLSETDVSTFNSNLSRVSSESSGFREKLITPEFKELSRTLQTSQSNARSHNPFEPRRGNKSSVMKHVREKIGRRFIEPSDVTGLLLEWNCSWMEQQKKTSVAPPIIHDAFTYLKVNSAYESVESYYNTYLPLHLLNIWMSMYESWERRDLLPDGHIESREEKPTYHKIRCSMKLKRANKLDWPRAEDILMCHVEGHPKRLFGKVVNVKIDEPGSQGGHLDSVSALIDIIFSENTDTNSKRTFKIQKLINVRIALNVCRALKHINPDMRRVILDPRQMRSEVDIIKTDKFLCAKSNRSNVEKIMRSIASRNHRVTLVRTDKQADSLKAITQIVPEVVCKRGLIFLCMKEETTFFTMAAEMVVKGYEPVLAVKDEDVPRLPRDLAARTLRNFGPKDLERCHLVITLMSAIFIGDLETRLQRDLHDEKKNAICLVHEAHYFLETETALLLEHNFRSLVLLGREGALDNLQPRLMRQNFNVSLFERINGK